jgi:hypothetical protein
MLKSIAAMSRKYFPKEARENEFIPFLEALESDSFKALLDQIPEAIVNREPDEFTTYDKVRVADLKP